MKDIDELTINESEFAELTGLYESDLYFERPKKVSFLPETDGSLITFAVIGMLASIDSFNKRDSGPAIFWLSISIGCTYQFWQQRKERDQDYQKKYQEYMDLQRLRSLHFDVQKYNEVIRGMGINDKLISVGTVPSSPKDRKKVVKALKLVRQGLVRALQTERILRENKDFIALNPSMFDSNLSDVESLRIGNEAVEWSKLFNQAIEVAVEVNSEMRKLQSRNNR